MLLLQYDTDSRLLYLLEAYEYVEWKGKAETQPGTKKIHKKKRTFASPTVTDDRGVVGSFDNRNVNYRTFDVSCILSGKMCFAVLHLESPVFFMLLNECFGGVYIKDQNRIDSYFFV